MQEEDEVDWYQIVYRLSLIDEDTPIPGIIDAGDLWAGLVASAKIIVRLERQLEVLTDRIDWEKM